MIKKVYVNLLFSEDIAKKKKKKKKKKIERMPIMVTRTIYIYIYYIPVFKALFRQLNSYTVDVFICVSTNPFYSLLSCVESLGKEKVLCSFQIKKKKKITLENGC